MATHRGNSVKKQHFVSDVVFLAKNIVINIVINSVNSVKMR